MEDKTFIKNRILRWLLPFVFIGLTVAGLLILPRFEKEPAASPVETRTPPSVEVISVAFEDKPPKIRLGGTVSSLYDTEIFAEITGKVIYTSEKLVKGGFFKKGDLILKIDDFDYKDALASKEAELASIKLDTRKERELAEQARKDWKDLGRGAPSDLALRKPNLEKVEAQLRAAESALEKARRDLIKTSIVAPFDCMVSSKSVSKGSFATTGMSLFKVYNVDQAEIRLAISPDDAEFIDLPKPGELLKNGRKAVISWKSHKKVLIREGYISRIEGEIDPETRFQYLIVRITDPYGFNSAVPQLEIGRFVDVEIEGKFVKNSFFLPVRAVSYDQKVMRVNEKSRINFVDVKIQKKITGGLLVTGDVKKDDKLIISKLDFPVEGTIVNVNNFDTGSRNGEKSK